MYIQWMEGIPEARFWSKVDVRGPSECWNWNACMRKGYGKFSLGRDMQQAHRVSWQIKNGQIPEGIYVLHACDNPSCCNPSHLFLGTQADNMSDMISKGRRRHGANSGGWRYERTGKVRRKDAAELSNVRLDLRLTPEERELLRDMAKKARASMSDYIRRLLVDERVRMAEKARIAARWGG